MESVEEEKRQKEYLFFDTETTGLPQNWAAPATDTDNWPRLVQLAWCVYRDGAAIKERNVIVYPEGFIIPEEAARVHGITTELAQRRGYPLSDVLKSFIEDMWSADALVAHNIAYDSKIMGAELFRKEHAGMMDELFRKPQYDTMLLGTPICRLPGPRGGYKWPKLSELHFQLFGEGFDNAHDAFADTNACARCFYKLAKLEVIKL